MKYFNVKSLLLGASLFFSPLFLKAAETNVTLTGLQAGDDATIIISSNEFIDTKKATENGVYRFTDIPAGKHGVKIEAIGYNLPESQVIVVKEDGSIDPLTGITVAITKKSEDPDVWNFEWREDQSGSGYTQSSNVNQPAVIEFLGKKTVPSDVPSFGILQNNYHILLSDDEEEWTQEYAYRITETLKTLPIDYYGFPYGKFTLTSEHLENDIIVTDLGNGYEARISKDCFNYANPFLVTLDGVKGALYSKRLHHALTNYLTDFGKDVDRVNQIMNVRFGCQILGIDYVSLTAGITNEDEGHFQQFAPTELVSIINMFEEMPEGFHAIPHLNYLVRRLNGLKNPIYPEAAAVAWITENGYIEFTEKAFGGNNQDFEIQRLILHEKTHFLWAFVFSEEIKKEWIEIGGWYPDPNSGEGWSTTKDTEFVTAYSHGKNPDEDMAESVAYYIKDPALLQSRAIEKYDFIRDRIMHGTRYISSIPDYLSFEVLNLWPDYDYPGKINGVSVNVEGAPDGDKKVIIEVTLNHMEGYDDGASTAFMRLTSPEFWDKDGFSHTQFVDMWLSPVDGSQHHFRGEVNISKYSKAGYWTPGDINIHDLHGNARYEGRNDCVVSVFINNTLEDLEPPVYEKGSLQYELTDVVVDGHPCQNLKVTYRVHDNIGISNTFARIYADVEGFNGGGTGLTDQYGTYDPETETAEINFLIKEYLPTADYYITFVTYYDMAGTAVDTWFTDSPDDEPIKKIHITTPRPDYTHPELDLNRIFVYAEPTHPEAPDGETIVTVNFYVKDDISGFGPCHYHFLDPQGIYHGDWFYHENFYTEWFEGDPTVWGHYKITHILPQGSAPGKWGLAQMMVGDKAGNEFTYNFVETLIFEPVDGEEGWDLFTDLDNDANLTFILSSETDEAFGFTYRIINEDTGVEIKGNYANTRAESGMTVNISELGAGSIILIVTAFDANGEAVGVKSAKVKIEALEIEAGAIELNMMEAHLLVDETVQLIATVIPEDTTDKTVTWESTDEDVAIVDETGLVTAVSQGSAIIIATCGEAVNSCVVYVENPVVEASEIILNYQEAEIKTGESIALEATVLPEEAVDKTVIWKSSDENIATVLENGLVTGISEGSVTITATCGAAIATCEVRVVEDAGIEGILADPDRKVSVYSIDGILIKGMNKSKDLKSLSKGIYIIICDGLKFKYSVK